MEDNTTKTIDFLRARLLAERSVSRTARQRAYELAKKVTELEKQLKSVSLQRKKAEKAASDVLAILENHDRNDLSEPFDSSSDQEEMSSDHNDGKHVEGFSGSEVESSSVNGRSLSWKSSKNSSSRFLDKKYMDASRRRRNSFTSTGSSPRRVGKSCRQIRHREHRSAADVPQSDDVDNGHREDGGRTGSEDVRNSADVAAETSLEELNICEEKDPRDNGHDIQNNGTERDMEIALQHQAQFIARYEAEEKAQRDWEDKFRENNGSTPDSCDPETHSDVTEERDEIKAPTPATAPACSTGSQEIDTEPLFPDQKNSGLNNNEESDNQNCPPDLQGTPRNSISAQVSSSQDQTLGTSYEPILGTQENPDKLGSVLEALQQAKLSLKQNLDKFPILENGPCIPTFRPGEKFPVPFSSAAGLFRLPTDYEYGGTTARANSLTYDSRLSLTNYPTEPSGGPFISSPYREPLSRSAASLDDRFRMVPTFPYQEIWPEIPRLAPSALNTRLDMRLSAHDPRLDVGTGPPVLDPRLGAGSSGLDPRFGVGLSAYDPRLEMGSPFIGDRYARSADSPHPGSNTPLRTRSMYDGHTRPNAYE